MIQWLFKIGMAQFRLDERFDAIDKRFDRIDMWFDRIEKRMGRIAGSVESPKSRVDRLDWIMTSNARTLDRIEKKVDAAFDLRERVAVLEALIGRRSA